MKSTASLNETGRRAAFERYAVMDTSAEVEFDDFTQLASQICQTPIALISLLDERRQWFKSKVGLEVAETPRAPFYNGLPYPEAFVFQIP